MLEAVKKFFGEDDKREILFMSLAGISLVVDFFYGDNLPVHPAWVAILICGVPIIKEAVVGLVTEFNIKTDVLVALGLTASVLIGEIFAAGEIALIMQLGAFLEGRTVDKARAGIEKLIDMTPLTARVVRGDKEVIIPPEQVAVGDILRVLPGETIAADGIITLGKTSIDQSIMSGESMPVDKAEGDEVSSGTVNQFGAFDMRATKVGDDSSIQRMIRLVQSADAGKAKIVRLADNWATWIVVIALTVAAATWLITGEAIRAVTILVVFCPCALVLATPTAIMAAIGNATKYGILVREGDALERLAQVKLIGFDKTGTLTYGKPKVVAVESNNAEFSAKRLYELAAAVEKRSEHPLGRAIVNGYKNEYGEELSEPSDFVMIPGRGIKAVVDGYNVLAGNRELLWQQGVAANDDETGSRYLDKGYNLVYLAVNEKMAGIVALADTVRDNAATMIKRLGDIGMIPMILTGDNGNAAKNIAVQLGVDQMYAECLPENKLQIIDEYQGKGMPVCMIGDGINDAPALKKAHVGIAMGGIGSDIAVDAADISLVSDDIAMLPHLVLLAKKMMLTIKLNMIFALGVNFIAIVLAVMGLLGPIWGALVHNVGSVIVIINSAILLNWQDSLKVSE